MKIGTKVMHAGLTPTVQGEPLLAGVTFAGVVKLIQTRQDQAQFSLEIDDDFD